MTIEYTEELKDWKEWLNELTERRAEMDLKYGVEECNCEPRPMIGRSWWKCHGFGHACRCAYVAEFKKINKRIEYLNTELKVLNEKAKN